MNFLKNLVSGPKTQPGDILPLSESEFTCGPSDCHFKYPTACFAIKGDAATDPLWESSKTPDLRILVKTGKIDWGHDALNDDVPSESIWPTISKLGSKLSSSANVNITSNVSSESYDHASPHLSEYLNGSRVDILILPWFARVNGVTKDNAQEVFNLFEKVIKESPKGHEGKFLKENCSIEGLEITLDNNDVFILLCSHNTRDKKCGQTAPYMKKEFESHLSDHGLHRDPSDDRAGGARVLFINHVGGHKFAANVLIYKRNGEFVWFARCNPLNVKALVEETIIEGKIFKDNVRTCKKFEAVDW